MVFEILKNVTPQPLKVGDVIQFVYVDEKEFTSSIKHGDKFLVKKTVMIPFSRGWIIPPEDYIGLDFSNSDSGLKLYPTSEDTIYEIFIGFRGHKTFLVFPVIPAGNFVLRLQESSMYPDLDNDITRYLGALKPYESPAEEPKFRVYGIKDFEPFYLYIYNDSDDYRKIILDFSINMVEVERLKGAEAEKYAPTRYVYHYDLLRW